MPRFLKQLLTSFAVLAMGYTQVYGIQRGYSCDHQGQPVEMQAEHCHRVEVADTTAFVPCDGQMDKSDCASKDTEHHAPVSVELKSSPAAVSSITIPSFVPLLLVEIPSFEWLLIQAEAEAEVGLNDLPPDTGNHLPSAVQVAKCMVLLV